MENVDRHNFNFLCALVLIQLNNSVVPTMSMNSFTAVNIFFLVFLYVFVSTEYFLRKKVQF